MQRSQRASLGRQIDGTGNFVIRPVAWLGQVGRCDDDAYMSGPSEETELRVLFTCANAYRQYIPPQ